MLSLIQMKRGKRQPEATMAREAVEQLVDELSEIDEGESVVCRLSSTLVRGDREYEHAQFTVEDRSNTDLSGVVGERNVAELSLYGHALDGGSDGAIEAWSLSVQERPDGSATTPVISGDYWNTETDDYESTESVEIEAVEREVDDAQ